MTFHKVVKAPAKRAHIKNYPHKKSEAESQRMRLLLERAATLVGAMFMFHGNKKLYCYTQIKEVEQELKTLRGYNEWEMKEIFIRAKHKHTKLRMGFY